jgi:hypothetical protein
VAAGVAQEERIVRGDLVKFPPRRVALLAYLGVEKPASHHPLPGRQFVTMEFDSGEHLVVMRPPRSNTALARLSPASMVLTLAFTMARS